MGTRGLTAVVLNGTFVVGQYGQWDHYPAGQGATILNFLKTEMDRDLFVSRLKQCRWITDDEFDEVLTTVGSKDGMLNMDQSDHFKRIAPQLERGMGGDILQFIQKTDGVKLLKDNVEFAFDSTFCEYAYVVDLDKNVFEVYSGYIEGAVPANNRFQSGSPVVLVKSYPLDDLPNEITFINDFKDPEELEEDLLENVSMVLKTMVDSSKDTVTAKLVNDFMEYSMDEFLMFAERKSS